MREGGHEPFKVLYFQISDVMTKGKVRFEEKGRQILMIDEIEEFLIVTTQKRFGN